MELRSGVRLTLLANALLRARIFGRFGAAAAKIVNENGIDSGRMELEIHLPDGHSAHHAGRADCCVVSPANLLATTDARVIRPRVGLLLRQPDGARSAQLHPALLDHAAHPYRVSRHFAQLLQNTGANCERHNYLADRYIVVCLSSGRVVHPYRLVIG